MVAACLYEFPEQRSRLVGSALELRMKLSAKHPRVVGDFHNLHKIPLWVHSRDDESGILQILSVRVVELVALECIVQNEVLCRCRKLCG